MRGTITIPILTTARLRLRGPQLDDFRASAAMWADPAVTRHIGGRASTGEEAWSRLIRYGGHWALLGYGFWMVEDLADGRFVGEVGFADFHRELEPGFGSTPEAGWALASWAHGRGYGREAVAAALTWADGHLGDRLVCMIDPGNAPSIAVATGAGFVEQTRATYKGAPSILFERHRP